MDRTPIAIAIATPTARRLGAATLLLAVLTAVLTGCSGSSDGATATTTTTTTTDVPVTAKPGEDCAWAVKADKETLNIAYPDTAATYWAVSYDLAPGEQLELAGRFPDARYASFISYGRNGGSIDVITDRDIVPDEGSANPFADGAEDGADGSYTLTVAADADADDPNALDAAVPAGGAAEQPATTTPEGVRLGSGGDGATSGTTLYRLYLPEDTDDALGGGGLPAVTLVDGDGEQTGIPTCSDPGPSDQAMDLVEQYGPDTTRATPPEPVFIRPGAGAATLYPNPDNVYIATIAEYEPGRIVVVRGKAPAVGEQVRYWSLCTNEFRKPYPVSSCAADPDVVLDDEGGYTFVISTPDERPSNATAADGVTWVDLGGDRPAEPDPAAPHARRPQLRRIGHQCAAARPGHRHDGRLRPDRVALHHRGVRSGSGRVLTH